MSNDKPTAPAEAGTSAAPSGRSFPTPPPARMTLAHECEACDLLALWEAANDRFAAGKEDAAGTFLRMAPRIRREDESAPPAVLAVARAAAAVAGTAIMTGYEDCEGPALRELVAGMTALLDEALR